MSEITDISVMDAAEILGLKPRQVQRLCVDGLLKAHKVGRAWIVNIDSVLHYDRPRPGLKPGQKIKKSS